MTNINKFLILYFLIILVAVMLMFSCSSPVRLLETKGEVIAVEGNRATILFKEKNGSDYRYDHFYIRYPWSIKVGDSVYLNFKGK